jgi:hypothetical protein
LLVVLGIYLGLGETVQLSTARVVVEQQGGRTDAQAGTEVQCQVRRAGRTVVGGVAVQAGV